MTSSHSDEANVAELVRLVRLTPDAGRAERTRLRCHAQLRRRGRRATRDVEVGSARPPLARAAAGAWFVLCALYVTDLVTTALRVHGVLR